MSSGLEPQVYLFVLWHHVCRFRFARSLLLSKLQKHHFFSQILIALEVLVSLL